MARSAAPGASGNAPQYAAVDATVSAAPKKLRGLVNAVLRKVARDAGDRALAFWRDRATLTVEAKGPQDFVSQADYNVEVLIRGAIEKAASFSAMACSRRASSSSVEQ